MQPRKGWIWALLVYLVIAISGNLLIQAELTGLYHVLFTRVALPIVGLSVLCAFFLPPWRNLNLSVWKKAGWTFLISLVMVFSSAGILNYLNAAFPGKPIEFSGPIVKKEYRSGRRSGGYYVYIRDLETGYRAEFSIKASEYRRIQVGDTYTRHMRLGPLGYAYNWVL